MSLDRTKIADHDGAAEVILPEVSALNQLSEPDHTVADTTVNSSAVMDVLRDAIERYTTGDGHEQVAWSDDHPLAATNGTATNEHRHHAAGYAPDRRSLAAVVVVLFFLVAGFGYQSLGGSSADTVKTNTSAPDTTTTTQDTTPTTTCTTDPIPVCS